MGVADVMSRNFASRLGRIPEQPRPRPRRKGIRLSLERLEDRLAPAVAPNLIGQLLPLYPPGPTPFGSAQADLPTAEVNGLYDLILGRQPAAAEQSYWISQLQGGVSLASVADRFLTSPEYGTILVNSYYQNFLGRAADSAGLAGWTAAVTAGADLTTLTVGFTGSVEYQALYPANADFVQSLYEHVLGRQGTNAEVGSWVQMLAGGTSRNAVALAFATSSESLTASVEGFYESLLQRPVDPVGLSYWVGQAGHESIQQVAASIVGSQEFQFRAASGTSGQAFDNAVAFNQQMLVPDPVTNPVTSGSQTGVTALTAKVDKLYQLILGRPADSAGEQYWVSQLVGGTALVDVVKSFLTSPEYANIVVNSYYQSFLGRSPDPAGLADWTAAVTGGADITALTVAFATSAEYQALYPTGTDFVRSLYEHVLGRQGTNAEVGYWVGVLEGGTSRSQVAQDIATSNESLTKSVEGFYTTYLQLPVDPAGVSYWVNHAENQPLSDVLAMMMANLEFPAPATPADHVPMNSPWGQAVVFPSVSYGAIQTGTAVQPTLTLPSGLRSSLNLSGDGGTFQMWFQAQNPGVLLSEQVPTTGNTATGSYPAPLIYINSDGYLVAGLFDQTALSIIPNQSPLSWQDSSGQTQVGAANPVVSQVGVLDGTWHHVALVFSGQSEALYLDGLLQGVSQPLYHQTSSNLTSPSTSLSLPLDQTPIAGRMIRGTIEQVNPANDTTFGPGGTSEAATFQGWVPASGQAVLNLTSTSSTSPVQSVTYVASSNSLAFGLSSSLNSANALTLNVAYPTAESAFSFTPASSSTYSTPVSTPGGASSIVTFDSSATSGSLTVGGTIVPEPTSKLYPTSNYPQGFVGAIDQVALWSTMLTQAQVQLAMSGPILPSGGGGPLSGDLVAYFPFSQTVPNTMNEWPNVVSPTTFASGPTGGTMLVSVGSTIPTDPFPNATRLPGARDWGLDLATPLASPSLNLASGQQFEYKIGLSAGDQLSISLPEADLGDLSIIIEDDLGDTTGSDSISPDSTQYLPAPRTGTYELTMTWNGQTSQDSGKINFGLIPGPLNSILELFTGYVQNSSVSQTNTLYAYSDPSLPGVNPTLGTVNATGPANYWPLWADKSFFPSSSTYTATDLNTAYQALDTALKNQGNGLADFGNLVGAPVTAPSVIQQYLFAAYDTAFGQSPPPAPALGPFPVAPAATAAMAVYEFLYNSNLAREAIYPVLTGTGSNSTPQNLPSWIGGVLGVINDTTTVPSQIETTIFNGQASQVHTVPVTVNQPSQKQSVGEILAGAAAWAAGGVIAALPGLGELKGGLKVLTLIAGGVGGGGASLAQSLIDNAFASGSQTVTYSVPVTAITNSELNYSMLSYIATSINAGALQQWTNLKSALTSPTFIQDALSNYGLLEAFGAISGAPLGDPAADPQAGITASLSRSAWQEMIPATFTWTPVQPYTLPSGDGRSNDWSESAAYDLPGGGAGPNVGSVAAVYPSSSSAPINLAAVNYGNTVTVFPGNGNGTFGSGQNYGLGSSNGAWGVISADFTNNGYQDLAVTNSITNDLEILMNNQQGGYYPAVEYGLNGAGNPQGIVSAKLNGDTYPDLAIADFGTDDIRILRNTGQGNPNGTNLFGQAVQYSLVQPNGATSIAVGDFNGDGIPDLVVSNYKSSDLSVLLGTGNWNNNNGFQTAVTVSLNGPDHANGLVVANLAGNNLSDIAVVDTQNNCISVLLSKGGGTDFNVATYYLAPGSSDPQGIALMPNPGGGPPDLVVACNSSDSLNIFYNKGDGTFYPAQNIPLNENSPIGLAVADFARNGLYQVAIADSASNAVYLAAASGVGNVATFLPGTGISTTAASGTPSFQATVNSPALGNLLSQTESLQGGNRVWVGPFNNTSLISPSNVTPPNFMAYTSLVYPSGQVPLSVNNNGLFLSLTGATLTETGQNGGTNLTYTQNGTYLNAWQLVDSNGNPIAENTMLQLFFGETSASLVPVNLTPVNGNQPFAAYNGGWYFAAQPVSGASATWADAFFNWGLGTTNYSPRDLVPTQAQAVSGQLPNTATPNVSGNNISYQVNFKAAGDSPPTINVGVPLDLSSYFNRIGIYNDGSSFASNGGLDGQGTALSGTLLGSSVVANGTQFILGTPGMNNVVSGTIGPGQTIPIPEGFSTVNVLGTGVNGNQPVEFTINYSDGTSQYINQTMSDWINPLPDNGLETTAAIMPYRNLANGTTQPGPWHLYAYALKPDMTKTIESITLPNVPNAEFLAITLT